MKNKEKLTENLILNKYLKRLNYNKLESFNFNNDAAYLKVPKNKQLIVTNDSITESLDFFSNDSPESIAHKIITCNLSDISSMGAIPYAYTLSLFLSKKIDKKWLKKFTSYLFKIQNKFNFFLIGGDLSQSNKISISSNFFGFASKGKILKRIGAKKNDDIWVTGNLGESTIGLFLRKKKIFSNKLLKDYFFNKYLYPEHCSIGNKLINLASSTIDISDGFFGDLENLLSNKKIGAEIFSKLIPISNHAKFLIKKNKFLNLIKILSTGDDYELLFTSNPINASRINILSKKNGIKITKVGKIVEKKGIYLDGKKINFTNKSFQHFS